AHRDVIDLDRDARANADPVRAAERAAAVVLHPEEWTDEPVLSAGRKLEQELDRSGDALDRAQQLMRRVVAEVVTALPLGEGERVGQRHTARLRREGRLDDERPRQIAALARERAGGPNGPVSGGLVEDAP